MHHRGALALSLLAVQLSCSTSKPPPLDAPLAAGQARAGKVTRQSELIGGPVAYGRVGDCWKLYNSKVRFLVQDVGTAFGLDIYGGNLIDADLVRAGDDGTNGKDLFRETFPIIGLHELDATSIEVISDGTHGGAAQIRVRGTDASSMILPQLDDLAQDLGGTITLDYILDPDVPYLKIVTTFQAAGGQTLDTLGLGDFMSFGASLSVISPENGFTGKATTISFMGSTGNGVSYGYVYPDGPMTLPLVDASGTATLLTSGGVPKGGTSSVTRYLVVGDGSASSVIGPMYALRKIATGHVSGVVRDAAGAPAADARVTLFHAPYGATSNAVDQARAGADGSYAFDEPAGDYVAIAGGIGRLRGAPTPITVGANPVTLDVAVGALGQAVLDVGELVAGAHANAPAKVSFLGVNVEAPDPRFGPDPTENERNGVHAVALSPGGTGTVPLKPGNYNVVVSRGVEFESVTLPNVAVPAGGSVTVRADLTRVVDTTGWISGDYHQHSQGSIDSPVPILERVAEDLAEGVELPAGTDHDNIIDFRPYIAQLHGEAWINAVPGDEVSVNGVGHFNCYPLTIDPAQPLAKVGTQLWARNTVDEFVTKLRGLETKPIVVHVSHPRTFSLAGYFNSVHYDPTNGQSMAPLDAFDAMEVNGDLGQPSDYLAANDAAIHTAAQAGHPSGITQMRDWFSLLNQGKTICALGNSDTHQRNGGTGYPRNFLKLGVDDPKLATGDALVAAIKAQKVSISNGPFVKVLVNGSDAMGKSAALNLAGAQAATLGVTVQAPSWVSVSTLEVYANGRPLSLAKSGPGAFQQVADGAAGSSLQAPIDAGDAKSAVVRLDGAVTVTPAKDTWYVVVVRGTGSMEPIAGGTPYAYANPVYVDTAGDGWTAPGLP